MPVIMTQQNRSLQKETNKHTACGYSLFTHCSFDKNKNTHNFYSGRDSIKKFCVNLKEIINRNNQLREKGKATSDKETRKELHETKTLPNMETRIR